MADNLYLDLLGRGIDAHPLDRARAGAHPGADLRAFERRARGGRRRGDAALMAQHDLGIGTDVNQQDRAAFHCIELREIRPRGIGTDMSADKRQKGDPRTVGDTEVEAPGRRFEPILDGQGERRLAQFHRRDPQEQVMHDRIADHDQLQDLVRPEIERDARVFQHGRHLPANLAGQPLLAALVEHHIGDPAHQILAIADLRIHRRALVGDLAARQVVNVQRERRRTDIDRRAIDIEERRRPDVDDGLPVADDGDELAFVLRQDRLKLGQRAKLGLSLDPEFA